MDTNQPKTSPVRSDHCFYFGRVYPAIWLIGIGFFSLLNNHGYLNSEVWGWLWPLFFIIPGVLMLLRPWRNS